MMQAYPVSGLPEIAQGDDLAVLLGRALEPLDPHPGDVVAVTQKVVSKAEGRVVPEGAGRDTWVRRETKRVVGARGDLVIAETAHGLVCANAGVDASNVPTGFLSLLPEDPDGSAERLRRELSSRFGVPVGVVITDTFGRPWRLGVVNVAIGCAGLPALIDLRGTRDHLGRTIEATVVALADEVAAAAGLVTPKDGRVAAALVRGVATSGASHGTAADLVRPADEDLFRASPLAAIHERRTIRSFGDDPVPKHAVETAVRAACTAPAPHHTKPWLFVAIWSAAAKLRYLNAMASAWVADLERDGTPTATIDRRLAASDAVLGAAPVLIVPALTTRGAHRYPDDERSTAERDMFMLAGGAGIQNLLLALSAQGLASSWISSSIFCRAEARAALALGDEWLPTGTVAVGTPPPGSPPPRPEPDLAEHLTVIDDDPLAGRTAGPRADEAP